MEVFYTTPMNHYTPETRKRVEADIDAELTKLRSNPEALLREIFGEMHNPDQSESGRLHTILGRIAVLLCGLNERAGRIQLFMVILTIAITVMTAVLVWLTWVMLSKMPTP